MPPRLIRELTANEKLCITCPVPNGCTGINSHDCPIRKQALKPRRPLLIQDGVLELVTRTGPLTANEVMESMTQANPRSIQSSLLRLFRKGKLTRSPIPGQRNRPIWVYQKPEGETACVTEKATDAPTTPSRSTSTPTTGQGQTPGTMKPGSRTAATLPARQPPSMRRKPQ